MFSLEYLDVHTSRLSWRSKTITISGSENDRRFWSWMTFQGDNRVETEVQTTLISMPSPTNWSSDARSRDMVVSVLNACISYRWIEVVHYRLPSHTKRPAINDQVCCLFPRVTKSAFCNTFCPELKRARLISFVYTSQYQSIRELK